MAVSHIVTSESHTGATGSISEASFSWTHASATNPQGVLIFVVNMTSPADIVTSVTFDGVTVPAVPGGNAADILGETGYCKTLFLGSGVPTTDNPLVVVNRINNTDELWAASITVSALGDTQVYTAGIVKLEGDGTLSEQNVDDGSPGTNSVRYAGGFSGLATPPGAGANSNLEHSFDTGQQTAVVCRESVAGQGSRPVGFSSGTSDDRAFVHLAIREVPVVARVPRFSPYPQLLAH